MDQISLESHGGTDIRATANGVIMVCLCEFEPTDQVVIGMPLGEFRVCDRHGEPKPIKLKSLAGLGVILHRINEAGDIEPVEFE